MGKKATKNGWLYVENLHSHLSKGASVDYHPIGVCVWGGAFAPSMVS